MTEIETAESLLAIADIIHTAEEVQAGVKRVAQEITDKLAGTNPLLLCVMTGGVPFAGHLMTQLDFPLEFDYMHVTRYGQDTSGGALSWRSAPWTPVKGRTVLIVDDILDEGLTLAAIVHRMLELGAKACYTAVATDKLNGKGQADQGPTSSAPGGSRPFSSSATAWTSRAPTATCRRSTR